MSTNGKLFVVATPIGNLGDISPRALEVLSEADFIAAEDTRVSGKLLSHFQIKKPMVSYFEHNRRQKGQLIVEKIQTGQSCAIITDAGTPCISDPGGDLVALAREAGIEVVAVPGCNAAIAALSISGLFCGRFCFEGFLSVNQRKRKEHLASLQQEERTMVFYEAPHKLPATLKDMEAAFGPRRVVLCREITKLYEQVIDTNLTDSLAYFKENPPKGEFVIVLEGAAPQKPEVDLLAHVEQLMENGASLKDAVKQTAKTFSASKNHLYQEALEKLSFNEYQQENNFQE